jgi:CheY-like chemotaxis protein
VGDPGRRLLVIEPNRELAALLAAAAGRLEVETVVCATGREALDRLAELGPAVAIVDLPLEDVRGSEVLSALARARVPAVAVSGVYRGPACAEQVRRLGALSFFEKPFVVEEVVEAAGRAMGGAPPPPGRPRSARARAPRRASGALGAGRVPRLLTALHLAQASGSLALFRGGVRKLVLLERGVPVYATSNVASERFGPLCVRRGLIGAADLEALPPGKRTAEALLERGVLNEKLRTEIVAEQVKTILWSTFEWRDGTWRFGLSASPRPSRLDLALNPGDLVLEGVMRTATLVRLREELPPGMALAPAPDPAFELYALALRPPEARLLALADGTKAVSDLLALSDLPEREALAFLQACRLMGVLDEVERVLASTRRMAFT